MALNMPAPPGENALNKIKERKRVERWVAANKNSIRDIYRRVAGAKVSDKQLERMARSDPEALAQFDKMQQADAFRQERESYFGEAKPFKHKVKKNEAVNNRNKINAALNFYGKLEKNFDTPEEYSKFLDARSTVDELAGTPEGKAAVRAYGYDNLRKAYQGIKGFDEIKANAEFFAELDPLMRREFSRGATAADVESIRKRFSNIGQYGSYLNAGRAAQDIYGDIGAEDLSGYGAGGITQAALQEEIYSGTGGDLQRRIEEARKRRKNAFTAGQSQVYGSLSEGGQLKQNLF